MGYTTTFKGSFALTPSLNAKQVAYLKAFAETRRMKRDALIAQNMPDPKRTAVGLPIGEEAQYFVGGLGFMGQEHDPSIVNCNKGPAEQPELWCHWVPSEDGSCLQWNEMEKFYNYGEWIKYIVEHFLKPWGIAANGLVKWRGEEFDDIGTIQIVNNFITIKDKDYSLEDQRILDAIALLESHGYEVVGPQEYNESLAKNCYREKLYGSSIDRCSIRCAMPKIWRDAVGMQMYLRELYNPQDNDFS